MVVKENSAWVIEAEDLVFSAEPWLAVRRQRIRTDSGEYIDDYYQVECPDFAIACALTLERKVITLWQYKHGPRAWGLTFPAGMMEAGEPAESAMRRELLEETGYQTGGAVHFLGRYACNGNQGGGWANLFLMEDCVAVATPESGDLETMELRLMSPAEVDEAVWRGRIHSLPNVAAWSVARMKFPNIFKDVLEL